MNYRIAILLMAFAFAEGAAVKVAHALRAEASAPTGAVYTASNAVNGNAILVFDRFADGQLQPAASVPTGGIGTGAGLGNQGGLILTSDERWLLVVNAGSNSVSVFDAQPHLPQLVDVQPTGGIRPISVTEHHGIVYVVHAGSDDITGFRLDRGGQLQPIDGSTRPLSTAAAGPAQIGFSRDGDVLVVTEKATNSIVTFQVDRDGLASGAQVQASTGATPFGFAFGKRDQLFVTEAFGGAPDGSATSSYQVGEEGLLSTISGTVATTETAACWAAVTPDGRFLYVANTGSGSISGYRIAVDGQIELLDSDGRTGVSGDGSVSIDLAVSRDGEFLYGLNGGTNTIAAFRVGADGSLAPLPFASLPLAASGLAAK